MELNLKNILIMIALIVVLIIVIVSVNKNKNTNSGLNQNSESQITYEKDEATGEYIIKDKNTGFEITRVDNEEAIKFYEDNPDYDSMMKSSDPDFVDPNAPPSDIITEIPDSMAVPGEPLTN